VFVAIVEATSTMPKKINATIRARSPSSFESMTTLSYRHGCMVAEVSQRGQSDAARSSSTVRLS